jgi:hypothetical protein
MDCEVLTAVVMENSVFWDIMPCSPLKLLSSRLLSKNVKIEIYKTIILHVVLCGYETWSLTLRKEHRLRVFENRMLKRIFGPKGYEIIGG